MPHLAFELGRSVSDGERVAFIDWVTERFAETMGTGTGHVAVSVHEFGGSGGGLGLGRAPLDEPVAVLSADIREGRSADQRADFASAVIDRLDTQFGVAPEHCYVVFTEHPGEDFHLAEGPLRSWSGDEGETGALEE
jgi:phenylpyruvate tautomerase PptA (4-oxalocrotonate tautomerase family)